MQITLQQARRFMLLKQGLLGGYKYYGKAGALDFIRRAGCVQFDPVDVCGQSADLVLLSRVGNYSKEMLAELLYKDRLLVDYFDKNLSVFPVECFPVFLGKKLGGGYAEAYDRRGGEAVKRIEPEIRRLIAERGHISAAQVEVSDTIEWHWGMMSSLPRCALESMYFRGELIIHHKTGRIKSYAFTKDYVSDGIMSAPLPFDDEDGRLAWHVLRRIGAVGLMWNRASDAWLGLSLKSAERERAFERLLGDNRITELNIESFNDRFYIKTDDLPLLEGCLPEICADKPRCELIAPLDSLIWDRKLIRALFGFDYTWEIYTPAEKRRYGAYVLPVLYGERFVGRVEAVCDRRTQTLVVKNLWYEDGIRRTKTMQTAVDRCLLRLARFNDCVRVSGKGE